MLDSNEIAEITKALLTWAEFAPDEPMVGFLGGAQIMTPRQIVQAVENNTSDGKAVLEVLEHGVRRMGIANVVERFIQKDELTDTGAKGGKGTASGKAQFRAGEPRRRSSEYRQRGERGRERY